jgi:thiamine-monophosphate kinase
MDEFEIIRRFFTPEKTHKRVIVGVGDDSAILRPKPGRDIVTAVDTLVAGVHFPRSMAAEDIGFRAVAVSASDIAAMGARPRWMTVAVSVGANAAGMLEDIANGIFLAGNRFGIDLVGGDTTHGSETVVSVQITGEVKRDMAITRSGAQAGDTIYISGYLGDAAAGLAMLDRSKPDERVRDRDDHLIRRFANPDPRIRLGRCLSGVASAAIDISDGLFADLAKLLDASRVGGVLDVDRIPLSPEILEMMGESDALNLALTGGDDYELCFTSNDETVVLAGRQLGVPVTKIGNVTKGGGLTCQKDGETFEFDHSGYVHF